MQAIQNTVNTQSQIIHWCVARRNNRYSLDTYKTFLIAIQMLQDEEKSKTLLRKKGIPTPTRKTKFYALNTTVLQISVANAATAVTVSNLNLPKILNYHTPINQLYFKHTFHKNKCNTLLVILKLNF